MPRTPGRGQGRLSAMSAPRTARSRVRAQLTLEIKQAARQQLALEGADRLSVRAVARELGMAPSALYRYFPSRQDLLTALIIEAYDALGEAVELSVAAWPAPDAAGRWRAGCRALRGWALEHPHEFALLYGSPVPGYRAPADTIAPATRVPHLLFGIVRDAYRCGQLSPPPTEPALTAGLGDDTRLLATRQDLGELPPALLTRAITAWTQLIGGVSLELFGHLHGTFREDAAFFDHTVELMVGLVGLAAPACAPTERLRSAD